MLAYVDLDHLLRIFLRNVQKTPMRSGRRYLSD